MTSISKSLSILVAYCLVVIVLLFAIKADAATTVTPVFGGGTGWGNLKANTVLLGNGGSAIATTTAGSNGQVLMLSGGVPTWAATSTGGTGTVTSVTCGTGLSGGTFSISGTCAVDQSTAFIFTAASTTHTGHLSLNNASTSQFGISGAWWVSQSGVLIGNGASPVTAGSTQTCSNQFVRAMSATYAATCNTVSLTADVTGTLGIGNGGTNAASFTQSGGILAYDGTREVNFANYTLTSALATLQNASTTNLTAGSSNYAVNPFNSIPFYMASSTWGTGTTTITLFNNARGITWVDAVCNTSAGTLETRLYHGTVTNIAYLSASTTANSNIFSSNNVLSTATTTYMDIGNAASSPTNINCTLEYVYNGSS